MLHNLLVETDDTKQEDKCVVRVRTSMWGDGRGAYIKKSITYLKRKSTGFNVLQEDMANVGVAEILPRIINIDSCEDGEYELITCNETKDWETGEIDEWDYRLIAN